MAAHRSMYTYLIFLLLQLSVLLANFDSLDQSNEMMYKDVHALVAIWIFGNE